MNGEIITSVWVILSQHRAQMDAGALGELRLAYRDSFPVNEVYSGESVRTVVGRIKAPEQHAPAVAKWEISGLPKVMSHCRSIR